MAAMNTTTSTPETDYFRFVVDQNWHASLYVSGLIVGVLAAFTLLVVVLRLWATNRFRLWRRFEIDSTEFGLGDQKITLHPNLTDMQIAFKIWVELSTRKIGLPIDLEDDVVAELYDSWHSFFSVTRELIKDVPVSRFRRKDTERIIRLSIEVLNTGIRPHLTKWHARFRRWYEKELAKIEHSQAHPQEIQKRFPKFDELARDLALVNQRLINYRQRMYELVTEL